jgi:soluble lytic murein transglycosylase-like protein
MTRSSTIRPRMRLVAVAALPLCAPLLASAAEHVTLRNGFAIDCVRREAVGDKIRLYLAPTPGDGTGNYMDVPADQVLRVEWVPDPPPVPAAAQLSSAHATTDRVPAGAEPTPSELRQMLSHAGAAHNIDAELLASVVHAESGGHTHAVSRTGARGLMQLMPGTASALGVQDSFAAEQNVEGGTRYLDQMLTRYKDNMALALAAYNAGPGAVDRFHGVPPFRETRAYVARIIGEFNRRKAALLTANLQPGRK